MNIYFITTKLLHENFRHAAGLFSDTNIVIADNEDEAIDIMYNLMQPYVANKDSITVAEGASIDYGHGLSTEEYFAFPDMDGCITQPQCMDTFKGQYVRYQYHIYDKLGEVKILNPYLRKEEEEEQEESSPVLPYDKEDSNQIPESYVKMLREQHDATIKTLTDLHNMLQTEHDQTQTVIDTVVDRESGEIQDTLEAESNNVQRKIGDEADATRGTINDTKTAVVNKLEEESNEIQADINATTTAVNAAKASSDTKLDAVKKSVDDSKTAIVNKLDEVNESIQTEGTNTRASVRGVSDKLDTVQSNINSNVDAAEASIKADIRNVNTNVNAVKSDTASIKTTAESTEAKVDEINRKLPNP